MKRRRAQSILEYIIVLAAIITAVIAATSGANSPVQQAIGQMFTDSQGVINRSTGDFLQNAAQ